jgi:hypothetical protein
VTSNLKEELAEGAVLLQQSVELPGSGGTWISLPEPFEETIQKPSLSFHLNLTVTALSPPWAPSPSADVTALPDNREPEEIRRSTEDASQLEEQLLMRQMQPDETKAPCIRGEICSYPLQDLEGPKDDLRGPDEGQNGLKEVLQGPEAVSSPEETKEETKVPGQRQSDTFQGIPFEVSKPPDCLLCNAFVALAEPFTGGFVSNSYFMAAVQNERRDAEAVIMRNSRRKEVR